MKKKPFLISIDTEGDNLWSHKTGDSITTQNAVFIERFQQLCNRYNFKPTYLVNYEMAMSEDFVFFAKKTIAQGKCEIGMHLHAWNTPPIIELTQRKDNFKVGHPFITEYKNNDIDKKVAYLTELINEKFGIRPVTHRAGRWATNSIYASILEKNGYRYDCSSTPGISWKQTSGYSENSFGTDYSSSPNQLTKFYNTNIIEIPFQSYKKPNSCFFLKSFIKKLIHPRSQRKNKQRISLRPNGKNLNDLLYIVDKNRHSRQKYLMFMLHSSEFMPGGSPTFPDYLSIEKLYCDLEILFAKISKYYYGFTIKEFGDSVFKKR